MQMPNVSIYTALRHGRNYHATAKCVDHKSIVYHVLSKFLLPHVYYAYLMFLLLFIYYLFITYFIYYYYYFILGNY